MTWQLITVGKKCCTNIYQSISYFYTFVKFIWFKYLDFNVFCCSQICGRWTAMEVLTTSLASWQKSRQAGGKNPIVSDCLFVVPSALSHVPPCPAMSYSTRFCLMSVQCRHVQIANSVSKRLQFIEDTKPWFLHDPNAEATWVSLCSFLHGITGVSLMCCTVSKRGLTCRAAEKDLPPRCLSRAGKCFTSKATRWRSTVCSWDLSKLLLVCLFSQPVFYISLVYVRCWSRAIWQWHWKGFCGQWFCECAQPNVQVEHLSGVDGHAQSLLGVDELVKCRSLAWSEWSATSGTW